MNTKFKLKKKGSTIEVSQDNGLVCFATVRAGKRILTEYTIKNDMEKFVKFLINNGYKRENWL